MLALEPGIISRTVICTLAIRLAVAVKISTSIVVVISGVLTIVVIATSAFVILIVAVPIMRMLKLVPGPIAAVIIRC